MAAEIWIGGKVTLSQAAELAKTIVREHVSLEWGEAPFQPQDATDLLDVRSELDGALVLHLCDDQACGGQLQSLEELLIAEKIPFRRISEGKYEYDPEYAEYRPDLEWPSVRSWIANHSGEPVVPVSCLRLVVDRIRKAVHQDKDRLARIKGADFELTALLPPETPPLPAFEVHDATSPPPKDPPSREKRHEISERSDATGAWTKKRRVDSFGGRLPAARSPGLRRSPDRPAVVGIGARAAGATSIRRAPGRQDPMGAPTIAGSVTLIAQPTFKIQHPEFSRTLYAHIARRPCCAPRGALLSRGEAAHHYGRNAAFIHLVRRPQDSHHGTEGSSR
jgi:hypothetical protein